MRNKNGGLTSSVVKDRYNKKNYEQVNFRLRIGTYPAREDIEKAATQEGVSLNAWLVDAVVTKLDNKADFGIKDLAAYARSAKMTEEEYIIQAVKEKMQRQDADFTEEVTRIKE